MEFRTRMTKSCSQYFELVVSNRIISVREMNNAYSKQYVRTNNGPDGSWFSCTGDYDAWKRSYHGRCLFLAAIDVENDELIGICSGVKLDNNVGFIGNYFVKKGFRGFGIGRLLWDGINKYLEGTNKCLVSVPEMVLKYSRHSMKCSKNTVINFAVLDGVRVQHFSNKNGFKQLNSQRSYQVIEPTHQLIDDISEYDTTVSHLNRKQWCLNWLLNHANGKSLVAMKPTPVDNGGSKENQSSIVGCGQIRYIDGCPILKISPLYADNVAVAKAILIGLLKLCPDIEQKEVKIFYLQNDSKTEGLLEEFRFEKKRGPGSMPFMFTEVDLDYNADKIFFIAEPEVHFV